MIKNVILGAFCWASFIIPGCKEPVSIYENCCGTSPTIDSIFYKFYDHGLQDSVQVRANVYIPNILIPDIPPPPPPQSPPSSLNSYFMICTNEHVFAVRHFVVTNEMGDTLFYRKNFVSNYPEYAWTGKKSDGSYHFGPFDYEVAVEYTNRTQKVFRGRACSFSCGDLGFPASNLPNCYFSSQTNGAGQPHQDPLLISEECF